MRYFIRGNDCEPWREVDHDMYLDQMARVEESAKKIEEYGLYCLIYQPAAMAKADDEPDTWTDEVGTEWGRS
jgi:hypothetical protein